MVKELTLKGNTVVINLSVVIKRSFFKKKVSIVN